MDANWQECLDSFLQSIENISGSIKSRARYAYILHAFFTDPHRNPDSYTRNEVQAFLDAPSTSPRNRGKPISPSTRNNRLMALSSFYRFADGYNDLLQTKPPTYGLKYVHVGISPHALSADELEKFFAVIPNSTIKGLRDRALFLTYFWSGRRRSEIARLKWRDLEHATIIEPDGSRRPGIIYRYVAKGKSRETQSAELPLPAYNAIIRYLEGADRLSTIQLDDFLFTSTRTDQRNRRLTNDYCNMLFKDYAAQSGLSSHYSLHSIRHCAARLRYEAGSSIQDVQVFLGHSSLATTDIYLKRLTGVSDPGAKLLESRFADL